MRMLVHFQACSDRCMLQKHGCKPMVHVDLVFSRNMVAALVFAAILSMISSEFRRYKCLPLLCQLTAIGGIPLSLVQVGIFSSILAVTFVLRYPAESHRTRYPALSFGVVANIQRIGNLVLIPLATIYYQ